MNALIVVDNPKRWPLHIPGADVVASRDYLTDPQYAGEPGTKVFNLCRSYKYQAAGYYVSLLAEARGHRPLPSVATMQDLRLAPVMRRLSQEIDDLTQTALKGIKSDQFVLSVYFGRNLAKRYDRLALAIFNQFPAPMLRVSFERDGKWDIDAVRVIGGADIPESHRPFVIEQAQKYFNRTPRKPRKTKAYKYDLAILHNPADPLPPSDPTTLRKFMDHAEAAGLRPELIEKDAYGRIAEFDALFIRETTAVNHHTFSFARRAAAAGLVVIDDPDSILRCTNKVYLAELLDRHNVPTPKALVFSEDNAQRVGEDIGFPCVIKQPDSSFSAGVCKINSAEEFADRQKELFAQTDLLLAQEFVPTEFDWRIGVLGGEPLYACRYHMARGHWQIIHRDGEKIRQGTWDTVALDDAPPDVVKVGVRAARLIGDGLYGLDIKVVKGKPRVIEINDNPNLDHTVEDAVIGDALYERLMTHFLDRIERRRR